MSQGRFKPLPVGDGTGDVVAPGTNSDGFLAQWDGTDSKTLKNGKAAPSGTVVGTTDSQTLSAKTLASPIVTGLLKLTPSTPASASASGTAGQVAVDDSYVYVCTATNTWKRVAITTW